MLHVPCCMVWRSTTGVQVRKHLEDKWVWVIVIYHDVSVETYGGPANGFRLVCWGDWQKHHWYVPDGERTVVDDCHRPGWSQDSHRKGNKCWEHLHCDACIGVISRSWEYARLGLLGFSSGSRYWLLYLFLGRPCIVLPFWVSRLGGKNTFSSVQWHVDSC